MHTCHPSYSVTRESLPKAMDVCLHFCLHGVALGCLMAQGQRQLCLGCYVGAASIWSLGAARGAFNNGSTCCSSSLQIVRCLVPHATDCMARPQLVISKTSKRKACCGHIELLHNTVSVRASQYQHTLIVPAIVGGAYAPSSLHTDIFHEPQVLASLLQYMYICV